MGELNGTHDAGEGEHSKAAILELGELEAGAVSALAEAKGVEAEVSGLAAGTLQGEGKWREKKERRGTMVWVDGRRRWGKLEGMKRSEKMRMEGQGCGGDNEVCNFSQR